MQTHSELLKIELYHMNLGGGCTIQPITLSVLFPYYSSGWGKLSLQTWGRSALENRASTGWPAPLSVLAENPWGACQGINTHHRTCAQNGTG
jgi:hypothetical protein